MDKDLNYIIASAGTGKTESIIRKVEDLIINKNIDVMDIALITFTNKATKEMKERLKDSLYKNWEKGKPVRDQLDKINMAKISTIHSFCDSIIREFGLKIGISPNYKINSFNNEMNAIADLVIENNYNENICSKIPTFIVKDILKSFYKEAKDKGISFKLKNEKVNNFWAEFRAYFYTIYKQFDEEVEKAKREKNVLTNNDLLHYSVSLLKDEYIIKRVSKNLKYIFIDECQDINYDQMRLFEILMDYVPMTIVGDEKQSIYSFRGSNKYAFNYLVDKMKQKDAQALISQTNYRTTSELINILNKIFNSKFYYRNNKLNFNNIPLIANYDKSEYDSVLDIYYNKSLKEILTIVALNLKSKGSACYNKTVILCRTNRETIQVASELKSENIPVEIYSSKSIYKSKSIIDLYKVLKYLITNSEIENLELFYTDYYLSVLKYFDSAYLEQILSGLKFEIKKESLNFVLNRLIEITRINDYYLAIGKEQYIANLNRIKEIIRDLSFQGLSNIQIVNYLNTMIETQQMEQEPETESKASIIVSTIHTYKGLSADVVLLYNADKNIFRLSNSLYKYDEFTNSIGFNKNSMVLNNYSIEEDKTFVDLLLKENIKYLEEELRILYVGCTRAKQKLVIVNTNPRDKIDYMIKNIPNYVSYTRWIIESDL